MAKKTGGWSKIKENLAGSSTTDLINLISELYRLNPENSRFMETRFCSSSSESLAVYKKIIKEALNPDIEKSGKVDFRTARTAISTYKKAKGMNEGVAELMVYYVETANQYTLDYGDMWEQFYTSVENGFETACDQVLKSEEAGAAVADYKKRLSRVVGSTAGIGWGYHDTLSALYHEAFGELC